MACNIFPLAIKTEFGIKADIIWTVAVPAEKKIRTKGDRGGKKMSIWREIAMTID